MFLIGTISCVVRSDVYGVLLIGKMSCVIRCVLLLEWTVLLMLEWQDDIIRTFLSVDIFRIMIFHKRTRKMSWQVRQCRILLMLEWQEHIIRTLLSVDIYRSMIFHKWTRKMSWQCIVARMGNTSDARVAR